MTARVPEGSGLLQANEDMPERGFARTLQQLSCGPRSSVGEFDLAGSGPLPSAAAGAGGPA